EPYVVKRTFRDDALVIPGKKQVFSPKDNIMQTTEPKEWRRTMAATTATTLTTLMEGVTQSGTAACCLQIPGVRIAAKTGTAQLNPEGDKQRSHAWITAFAPAEAPKYAVAVMLKGTSDEISAGTGGRLAGPIACKLIRQSMEINAKDAPCKEPG
ncbi:MAG: penicillin-binding transpeptidase domain-containing protein, partial [Actinomycetota bacterium]